MLVHQIPPKPDYLRVKIGRRLGRIGAVPLKNTVYVLPSSDGAREDFQWILREVVTAGGDATLLDAQFVDGLTDRDVEALFRDARDTDYAVLAEEARRLEQKIDLVQVDDDLRRRFELELARLERRLEELASIDFFDAGGRQPLLGLVSALRKRLTPPSSSPPPPDGVGVEAYARRTWVTRSGIHVDRIASAWLIRRFIDAEARFQYVPAKGYFPEPGELRFDMFDAEFTHEGDLCTFEVLCQRLRLTQPGISAIAEIIHDIDVKDAKFGRPETAGVAAQINGLCLAHREDEERLRRGEQLLDDLLTYFARKTDSRRST